MAFTAEDMVDRYLREVPKIERGMRGNHKSLHLRASPTKGEVDLMFKKLAKMIHPDKRFFQDWIENTYDPAPSEAVVDRANEILLDFYTSWVDVKDSLAWEDSQTWRKDPYIMHVNCQKSM
jgi:hypothetical protein